MSRYAGGPLFGAAVKAPAGATASQKTPKRIADAVPKSTE